MSKLTNLIKTEFNNYESPNAESKKAFHRMTKAFLKKVAALIEPKDFKVSSNMGGPAVTGEVHLHTDKVYVMVSAARGGEVMYRSCEGTKDFTGGCNNWESIDILENPEDLADVLKPIQDRD